MPPSSRIRGFTLVEILIVAAIMAVLTTITLPALSGARERTAVFRARGELALVAQALENYRRTYGDYPQTGDFEQAAPDTVQPLLSVHAQSKLFNALTGVFGPRAFAPEDSLNGKRCLDPAKFTLEFVPAAGMPIPEGGALRREEVRTSLLDPWGRRYLYYYKCAGNPGAWKAAGYRLYSAGPDGRHAPPDTVSGLGAQDLPALAVDADNVYADATVR